MFHPAKGLEGRFLRRKRPSGAFLLVGWTDSPPGASPGLTAKPRGRLTRRRALV